MNNIYNPIQIPYILGKTFKENIQYTEVVDPHLAEFVICFWFMEPASPSTEMVDNIIVPDGCIDLVVDVSGEKIGYAGMSKTEFQFGVNPQSRIWGARLRPGAFHQLTGIPATQAMDTFLSLDQIDSAFVAEDFFARSRSYGAEPLTQYLQTLCTHKIASDFMMLFEEYVSGNLPVTTAELYGKLNYSPKQCQRLFMKHFGISPKMVLSVIRFQQCLRILTAKEVQQSDVVSILGYYDQPHLIKDLKKNIGITPLELIRIVNE